MDGGPAGGDVRTLWIGELEYYMTEEWLLQLFLNMGFSTHVKLIRDRTSQTMSGYGFVEFGSHEDARRVLESYNGREIPGTNGKVLRLNWASFGVTERRSAPAVWDRSFGPRKLVC